MFNEAQQRERELKVYRCASEFLKTGASNKEIGEKLGIPTSSVQRYLNDEEIISGLLGRDAYLLIQEMIKENKKEALSRGGKVSQSRCSSIRDKSGKFIGNRKSC